MGSDEEKQKWFPLESNPALMNDYVRKLGFKADLYEFVDVFSAEDWALEMIPKPVIAVLFLYPLTAPQLSYEKSNQVAVEDDKACWFIKQRIGNACGTIGLLHAILNAPSPINEFEDDSWLETFQMATLDKDPLEKAEILESDSKIASLHEAATSSEQNQTSRGQLDDDVITHFVALVHRSGQLYELDGRKAAPIPHGTTSPETLLSDACRVIKEFMARDPDEIRFTILALAPKQD
jgi:ubiquitin carboxyl-terminal hydrolase L3